MIDGSVTGQLSILRQVGEDSEYLMDIIDLMPFQTLPILLMLSLKYLLQKLLLLSLHREVILLRYNLNFSCSRALDTGSVSFIYLLYRRSLLFIEIRIPFVIQGLDLVLLIFFWSFFCMGHVHLKGH